MAVTKTTLKRYLCSLLGLVMLLTLIPTAVLADPTPTPAGTQPGQTVEATQAPEPTPTPPPFVALDPSLISAKAAILIDGLSGKVLFEKDADTQYYPASITKVMTALLALEKGDLSQVIVAGNEINQLEERASHIGMRVGEELTLEQLLYGLMLNSGNDAANTIAVAIGGTMEGFATLMNEKAQALGMTESHFVNPNGLHNDDHYVSARDMATLTMAAMQNETFAKIVSTRKYQVPPTNKVTETRYFVNGNRLISDPATERFGYTYAVGVKTGYTTKAESTLVSAARKDGMLLISVVLKDSQEGKWTDSIKMFEHGFSNYASIDLMTELAAQPLSVQLPNAAEDDPQGGLLLLTPEADADSKKPHYVTVKLQDKGDLMSRISQATLVTEPDIAELKAPITEGTIVGSFRYEVDGETILSGKLRASRTVAEKRTQLFPSDDKKGGGLSVLPHAGAPDFLITLLYIVGGGAALILFIVVVRTILTRKRRMRRRGMRYRPKRGRKGRGFY